MVPLRMPTLLSDVAARSEDPQFDAWTRALPALVAEMAGRWDLTVGEPYEPGGQCSWVAPATTASGDEVVLKVGWRHPEAEHEADALRFWGGDGAALLYASDSVDSSSVLLMERCVPGTQLARTASGPEQDEVLAGLLRRLWKRPPDGHPFRPLSSMCDFWADEFEAKADRLPAGFDPGITHEGITLYRELPRTSDDDVLLCTDLHSENILAAEREPWLVVDPKPYVGDRTYDAVQHLLNVHRLAGDPIARADRMADLLDLDRERLRLWLFARCVQESPEWDGLYDVALRIAP